MISRRKLIQSLPALGISSGTFLELFDQSTLLDKEGTIDWESVRALFPITRWDKIQLNSGSAGVMPEPVSNHLIELIKYLNSKAPYMVWSEWQKIKEENLVRLARMNVCDPSELQVVRNTTEALNMIIYGLPLQKGDEVIISKNDYPFAVNAWKNRAERDSLIVREVMISLPGSDQDVVNAYKELISKRTRAIHITHMTHREGHIMPVRALTKLAKQSGAFSIIDGAHIVGQIPVDLHQVNCDFYASSLHKWLNAPLGTGMLYVRHDQIPTLFNHPSSNLNAKSSMDKFEHLGTRAWSNEIGLSAALDFHEMIGTNEKLARLQELKMYWTDAIRKFDKIRIHTNTDSSHSAAVATFSIAGRTGGNIVAAFDEKYNIHAKSVSGPWGSGVRISVNIYTNTSELDRLIAAIKELASQ